MSDMKDFDTRLQSLLDKRGQDFIEGIVAEFGRLAHEIVTLRRELAALTDYQASRDRWLAIERTAEGIVRLPRFVNIGPDQALQAQDGFYQTEWTSAGLPFRWTGPSPQFSFDLFVDRTHSAELRLNALSFIDFEVQKHVMLLVDGERVALTAEPSGEGLTLTGTLPSRQGCEATNLVFLVPATLKPPASEDNRSLGLAFASLTVVALDEKPAQDRSGEDGRSGEIFNGDGAAF
ncbi:MAG: hypothetical protein WDM89_10035 [Rhizomicrobium sp.]